MTQLTRTQFDALQDQWERLPDLGTSYSNSGEHYRLVALLNSYGYHPSSREAAIKLAERLLSHGYSN